ncbi:MAG TPA: hypothetical protein DIW43_04530 [Spongiibacteraceae bacterium]|nr:hypothetical protein [Spongiibacteraceae bacterium]HCS26692.1 hypothetical protein [Spongiibacteraceae bacterium]
MRHFHVLLLAAITVLSSASHSTEVFDYADIAYSRQNTDFAGFGDSSSGTLKASVSALDRLHARARYNAGNVKLPANNAQQDSWTVLGLGAHYPLSNQTAIFLGSDHNELELQNGSTERGWYHHIGVRHEFSGGWQLGFEIGESDVLFRDTTFLIETVYKVARQIGVSATVRDYDDLDLTEYEVGLRWFFRD